MKPVKSIIIFKRLALVCIYLSIAVFQSKSQCASSLKSMSYNILLNGTGNNLWGFYIPQFDPSSGTLVAVDIQSVVSVNAKFTLYNLSTNQDNFRVVTGRNDSIFIDALSTPISNSYSEINATYNLQQSQDTVGAGTVISPQFYPLMNNYKINDSVTTAVAGFLGNGYVSFHYKPESYVSVTSGSSFNINNTFSDTMKIFLTYYYCDQNVLAEDLINFFVKENNSTVKLSWQIENETAGKTYQVEESTDGKIFNKAGSVESVVRYDGTGSYAYTVPAENAPVLYFRIKEIDANGNYKYSLIRTAEMDKSDGMYLYPNPSSSFINVAFNDAQTKNYAVEIYTSNGNLVQNNNLTNTNNARIPFVKTLASGIYFIRATDQQTQKKYTSSFIVQ